MQGAGRETENVPDDSLGNPLAVPAPQADKCVCRTPAASEPSSSHSTSNIPPSTNSRLLFFLLNLYFWPLFFLTTLVGIPVLTLLVALPAPFRPHRRNMRAFRMMIVRYGRLVLAGMFPLVRLAREQPLEASPQPCIYICNHRSASDPFLMALLPGEIVQVVNVWPFHLPVLGWFAKWAGYLSVREMPFERFSETAARYLEQGINIAAFPEGTRSGEGPMGPFHSAMFRVALDTGVPVVPVCISGNQRIPPKGSWCLHPGTIHIRVLPPVTAETYSTWSPFTFKNRVHDLIKEELARMEADETELTATAEGRGWRYCDGSEQRERQTR